MIAYHICIIYKDCVSTCVYLLSKPAVYWWAVSYVVSELIGLVSNSWNATITRLAYSAMRIMIRSHPAVNDKHETACLQAKWFTHPCRCRRTDPVRIVKVEIPGCLILCCDNITLIEFRNIRTAPQLDLWFVQLICSRLTRRPILRKPTP